MPTVGLTPIENDTQEKAAILASHDLWAKLSEARAQWHTAAALGHTATMTTHVEAAQELMTQLGRLDYVLREYQDTKATTCRHGGEDFCAYTPRVDIQCSGYSAPHSAYCRLHEAEDSDRWDLTHPAADCCPAACEGAEHTDAAGDVIRHAA